MSSHDLATLFHRAVSHRRGTRARHTRTHLALLTLMGIGTAQAGTSSTLTLSSDYVFRGISQSNQQPVLQAGIEHAADGGLYAGAWGSNIHWLADQSSADAPISSSLELDIYAGYRRALSATVSLDVGAQVYAYPGTFPHGFKRADTLELYAGAGWAANDALSLGAKLSVATTDSFGYAGSSGSPYLDLNATVAMPTSICWRLVSTARIELRTSWMMSFCDFCISSAVCWIAFSACL